MVTLKCKEVLCLTYSGLLFISGILLVTFSIILSYKIFYHFNFIPSGTLGPFIVILILGILHLFLTWLGVKGPPREHNFYIILFVIFTLILLISEFAVGIWTIILWSEVPLESHTLMTKSFTEMVNFDKKEWIRLQNDLKCCGLTGPTDYSSRDAIPISCADPSLSNKTVKHFYETGCQKPLIKYVKNILLDGTLLGFISGVLQIIGILTFYTFFKSLRKERAERIARRNALHRQGSGRSQHQNPSTPPPVTSSPPLTISSITTSA